MKQAVHPEARGSMTARSLAWSPIDLPVKLVSRVSRPPVLAGLLVVVAMMADLAGWLPGNRASLAAARGAVTDAGWLLGASSVMAGIVFMLVVVGVSGVVSFQVLGWRAWAALSPVPLAWLLAAPFPFGATLRCIALPTQFAVEAAYLMHALAFVLTLAPPMAFYRAARELRDEVDAHDISLSVRALLATLAGYIGMRALAHSVCDRFGLPSEALVAANLVLLAWWAAVLLVFFLNTSANAEIRGRAGSLVFVIGVALVPPILSTVLSVTAAIWFYRGFTAEAGLAGKIGGGVIAFLIGGSVLAMFGLVIALIFDDEFGPLKHSLTRLRVNELFGRSRTLAEADTLRRVLMRIMELTKGIPRLREQILNQQLMHQLEPVFSRDPKAALLMVARLMTVVEDDEVWKWLFEHAYAARQREDPVLVEEFFAQIHKDGLLGRASPSFAEKPPLDLFARLMGVKDEHAPNLINEIERYYSRSSGGKGFADCYRWFVQFLRPRTFRDLATFDLRAMGSLPEKSPFGLDDLLRRLVKILDTIAKSDRVELEHKLPYFAAAMEALSDAAQTADTLPPQHRRTLVLTVGLWTRIVTSELMTLKGCAKISLEIKQRRFYLADRITVPLELQNVGNSVAEDIKIAALTEIADSPDSPEIDFPELDILPPRRPLIVNAVVHPRGTGQLRLAAKVSFGDLETKGKTVRFADAIEIVAASETATTGRHSVGINPYVPGRPIRTHDMFFGRQDVVSRIETSLRGRHQDNVVVLQGERRSGKTSILYHLLQGMRDAYLPVLVDFQGLLPDGNDYLLWHLAMNISESLKALGLTVPLPAKRVRGDEVPAWFRSSFLPAVRAADSSRPLLLLLDEFEVLEDRIREGKLDKSIFPFFRSLLQHQEGVAFVFSGTNRLEQLVSEYWSILFNIAVYIRLDFLSPADARRLIVEPVEKDMQIDDFAVERIISVSSGHPFFIQLLCFHLYNLQIAEQRQYVTGQDVERVIENLLETQTYTHFIWKDADRAERYMLAVCAQETRQEGGSVTPVMVRAALAAVSVELGAETISHALMQLAKKGVLVADEAHSRYRFRVDLMRRWLAQYKPMGVTIEECGR